MSEIFVAFRQDTSGECSARFPSLPADQPGRLGYILSERRRAAMEWRSVAKTRSLGNGTAVLVTSEPRT